METTSVEPFIQLTISLALGLLVGLQRQWAEESPIGGIRTFSLICLLGTLCSYLSENEGDGVLALGFIGTLGVTISGRLFNFRNNPKAPLPGLVHDFSMLLTYLTGVLVHTGPTWLAAFVAGILAFLLQAKFKLHGFARRFTLKEISAIMRFALISLVILPVVPNHPMDPLQALNLYDIWLMVVLIVAISLFGYLGYKFFGAKAGVLLGGILGGLISSTATTVSYSKRVQTHEALIPQSALVILVAWTVLYVRVPVEIAIVAPGFTAACFPIGILFLTSAISTAILWRKDRDSQTGMLPQSNPTELKAALSFALVYMIVLLAVAYSQQKLSHAGLTVIALLSGITDVDAISLSVARLVATQKLGSAAAWPLIVTAILSNLFFKGLLAGFLGGRDLFKKILFPWLCTLGIGILLLSNWPL